MKLSKIIFTSIFLLAISFLLTGCGKKQTPVVITRPKIEEPVNIVPIEERAYTTLEILRNGQKPLGKELNLTVADSKEADTIEYELEYQAGTSVQGGVGTIFPSKDTAPYEVRILLGSCSAGGACSYHEGVKGGTILLRFKGSQVGNLKGEWSYYVPNNNGKYSSRDGKFQIDASDLESGYTIISQTMGVPKVVNGEILAGPYHLDSTAKAKNNMSLTMRLNDEADKVKLLMWNGKSYKTIAGKVDGKTLTANINSLGTYLVVR